MKDSIADTSLVQLGKNAYARKKSQMYRTMKEHAVDLLTAEGYGHLLDDSKPFYKHMEEARALPENLLLHEVDKVDVGGASM